MYKSATPIKSTAEQMLVTNIFSSAKGEEKNII